jgi:enoyl-[acyl-carrier protein] reductase I
MVPIDLSGKVALVAGVANQRSLAWGIAQKLAEAGARMILTYQSERFLGAVEKLTAEFDNGLLYECDVSSDESLDKTFEAIRKDAGRLDVLVHSIAFAKREELEGAFTETSRDGFQLALGVSAYSLLAMARRAAPLMAEGGSMVTLSYLAAQRSVRNYNVMGTAKAALEQIVRQLALELGPKSIRVNAISAGPVSTVSARGVSDFLTMLKDHADRSPMKRNITAEEVGTTGLFLCSDLSSGITGETLFVDCGFHSVI